jgi:hypothetical protein
MRRMRDLPAARKENVLEVAKTIVESQGAAKQ